MDEIQAEYEKETGDLYPREDRGLAEDKRWYERFAEWITYTKIPTLRSALQSARAERERLDAEIGGVYNRLQEAHLERDTLKAEAARMREAIKDAAKLYDELAIMTDPLGSAVKYGPDFEPPTEEEWRESILEMRKALDDALLPPAAPEKAETCVWSKKNMMNGEKYTGSCGYTIIHPDYEGIIEKDCPGCGKPIAEGGEG